jgi:glycosyltransferase involved in cell wall biosynthesis
MTMTQPMVQEVAGAARESAIGRPIHVYMMDMLPTVPYYTGSLSASLNNIDGLRVSIGCVTYYLDRDLFHRERLVTDPALLDLVSRLRTAPAAMRRALKLIEYLTNLAALVPRFLVSRPDVIHVQFLPTVKFGLPVELWFLQIARRLGIKVVYTVHNVLPQDTGERHRAKYQRIYQLADRLICHDAGARDRLIHEFRVSASRISVIAHGPLLESGPTASIESFLKKMGIPANRRLVLWQGILRPYKGVSFLLNAWKQVQSKGVRATLMIVGNGEEEMTGAIRSEVARLGIESSVVLDFRFVSIAELSEYYSAADVLAYPYREITTSGALMTGIGYGKAIVATRQPAFRQVLREGESALMVEYGDVEDLAHKLTQLIEDPQLRVRLGEQARKSYVNGPQWPDIAKQTLDCYRATLPGSAFNGKTN